MAKVVKRKKKPGEHSSPETSGVQNLDESYIKRVKGTGGGQVENILKAMEHGKSMKQEYKGLWTNDALEKEIFKYFEFCAKKDMKPAKAGLRLWLGVSKSQYWEWETNPQKHSDKSNLLGEANDFMENQYVGRLEQYPTGNIFLLKSSHGHQDKQEVEITNKDGVSKEDVSDAISKLGLDGKK